MSAVSKIAELGIGECYDQMAYFVHPASVKAVNKCKQALKNTLSTAIVRAKLRNTTAVYQMRVFHTHLHDFDVVVAGIVRREEDEL